MQKDVFTQLFIQKTGVKYPKFRNLVLDIAELLGLDESTVRRKLNGESKFSIEQIVALCSHFQYSLDELLGNPIRGVTFRYNLYEKDSETKSFLSSLHKDLLLMHPDNTHIYYATRELPLIYYFRSAPLTAFKFYVFSNMVWREENRGFTYFELNDPTNLQSESIVIKDIYDLFCRIDTYEIWNQNIIDNTLSQIMYFASCGHFKSKETAIVLIDEFEKLILSLADWMHQGHKTLENNQEIKPKFQVFNNEIAHTNNVIVIETGSDYTCYLTHDNPNFIKTDDCNFGLRSKQWIEKLGSTSQSLSYGNMKDKETFVNELLRRIQKVRAKLLAMD